MKELELTGLEITEDNRVVRLERTPPAASVYGTVPMAPSPTAAAGLAPAVSSGDSCVCVTSPLVGVFYAAPAENADPFVKLGDRVEKGQTLCIVEAMKLMNEITAEESGIVERICVTNGQVVEFGTALFSIRR